MVAEDDTRFLRTTSTRDLRRRPVLHRDTVCGFVRRVPLVASPRPPVPTPSDNRGGLGGRVTSATRWDSAIGVPAIWLPADLLDDAVYGPAAARALTGGLRGARLNHSVKPSERRIQVRSLSLQRSEVASIAMRISRLLGTHPAGTVEVVDTVALPQHRIPVLGDPQHYDDRLEEPFDGDTMVRRLPPLLPSNVQSADPWKLQWWIEVEQPETPLPARSRLNTTVVAPDGAIGPSARCGRNQVSYPSHSMGLVVGGSSLAQMAVRPACDSRCVVCVSGDVRGRRL